MKYFYIALTRKENNIFYPYFIRVSNCENLLHKLNNIPGIICANICTTKRDAIKTINAWRDIYSKQETMQTNDDEIIPF